MQWKPIGDQNSRIARAEMLRTIREFFYSRQVLEVETPAVSASANTDPYIESFEVHSSQINSNDIRYLHTSPEYAMKRLLAAGSGDIYQICKVWRAEPSSRQHNAEFSMLEYYRLGFDLEQLMQEVEHLLKSLLTDFKHATQFATYESLFLDNLGINPHNVTNETLKTVLVDCVPGFKGELDRQSSLDLLMSHCIEPFFPNETLTFVYDYPASQSALAKTEPSADNPNVKIAKRFEVYAGNLELGNGYKELTLASKNESVLKGELETRRSNDLPLVPIDEHFLAATKAGLPECAGIAIGLDRVLMLICGKKKLQEVINFSWENA